MAWGTPLTAVSNAALTAAQWNASVRDNLNETAVAKATAAGQFFVSTGLNALAARTPGTASNTTAENTTSTSYATLTAGTAGPAVTVTTGTKALVFFQATMAHGTSGVECKTAYAVSGASTAAAADETSLRYTRDASSVRLRAGVMDFPTLTAGSNTFTMQYAVGSGTGTFDDRTIVVVPF